MTRQNYYWLAVLIVGAPLVLIFLIGFYGTLFLVVLAYYGVSRLKGLLIKTEAPSAMQYRARPREKFVEPLAEGEWLCHCGVINLNTDTCGHCACAEPPGVVPC